MLVTFCKSTGDGGRLLRTRLSSTTGRLSRWVWTGGGAGVAGRAAVSGNSPERFFRLLVISCISPNTLRVPSVSHTHHSFKVEPTEVAPQSGAVAWKSYKNSTLFSEVFLLTRNFISGPDAQGSPAFSGNDGTKFAKKLNSFFWSADFTDTTNASASLAPLRRAEGLRVPSSRTKEDDRGA